MLKNFRMSLNTSLNILKIQNGFHLKLLAGNSTRVGFPQRLNLEKWNFLKEEKIAISKSPNFKN